MSALHGPSGTLEPGLLLRRLDGELARAEADALDRHLASCEACRELAAAVESRDRRLKEALRKGDPEAPGAEEWGAVLATVRAGAAPGPRRSRLLVAAGWAVALLGVATAVSPPLRAWVAEWWADGVGGPERVPAAPAGEAALGEAALAFRPSGDAVEVRFESVQAGGALSVRFGDGDRVAVAVTGGGSERLAVGGGGLRVANDPASRASYDISLSSGVERVSVRVGGLPPVVLTRSGAGRGGVVVELERGTVRKPASGGEH